MAFLFVPGRVRGIVFAAGLVLCCTALSLAKPALAFLPVGALILYFLYMKKPPMAIFVTLLTSPLLDQASLSPVHGLGFDLAGVIRGSALLLMWIAIATRFAPYLQAHKRLLMGSIAVLITFTISLASTMYFTYCLKELFSFGYWVTFYIYLTFALKEDKQTEMVQWGLIGAAFVIILTMAPYEIHHVYQPYTNGSLSIYGKYNSGPFNLALSIAFLIPMFSILRTKLQMYVYLPALLAMFGILEYTYVRTGIAIVLLFLIYYLFENRRTRLWVIGIVIIGAISMANFSAVSSGWLNRLGQGQSLNDFSSGRLELYSTSITSFTNYPWSRKIIGEGFGSARYVIQHAIGWLVIPQNDFFSVLLGAGLLGVAGILVFLYAFIKDLMVTGKGPWRRFGLVVLLVVLFTATINGIFTGESTAMVFAMSLIAAARQQSDGVSMKTAACSHPGMKGRGQKIVNGLGTTMTTNLWR